MSKTPRRMAFDYDTALHDDQWAELVKFLKPKLSDADMETVTGICRGGESAPAERSGGAADAAVVVAKQPHFPHMHRLKP